MRTLLAVVTVLLLSCGDDKPAPNKAPNPPDFAPDRAAVDQNVDGGAPDAR